MPWIFAFRCFPRPLPAACLLISAPAQAQFTERGPKLIGKGVSGQFAEQGYSVSISADGNTAIVGGPDDGNEIGAAWVFILSGGVWSQQGSKLAGTGASTFPNGSEFGASVSLSGDGNTAAVGAPGANGIWIFTRSGNVWTQQGSELTGTTTYFADQGTSVSLSGNGNAVIEGGPLDSTNGIPSSGASWIFIRSPSDVWSQLGPKLVGTGAFQGYYTAGSTDQGASVALSSDGTTAIVGGPVDDNYIGAAWAFALKFAGTPGTANCFGQSVTTLQAQYGGLNGAAAALGFSSIRALQNAILAFCEV